MRVEPAGKSFHVQQIHFTRNVVALRPAKLLQVGGLISTRLPRCFSSVKRFKAPAVSEVSDPFKLLPD